MNDDASELFEVGAVSSLLVDDIFINPTSLTHSANGPDVASWVIFNAFGDDGRLLIGNLYTPQTSDEVMAILEEALSAKHLLEIRAQRSLSQVPGSSHVWIVGDIRIAPPLDAAPSSPKVEKLLQ